MKNLDELKIAKDYYKAKYLYIKMKINKLMKEAPTETEYKKTINNDTITIESISENESEAEPEPESDNTVSSFFNIMIIQETNSKIKRSESYIEYVKFCKTKQYEPLMKSIFFKSIESFLGKPTKTNVYCYKNYRFVESDTPLSFNESIEQLIF
jgi:hypothetical protein